MSRYDSVFRSGLLQGQVILISGGGTGIGRCIAHELASLGAHVVLAARRAEPLQQTVAEILHDGGRADWLTLNIRDEEAVDAAVREVLQRHGRLDALVNNAGGQFASDAASIRAKGWRAVIDTNLNGTFWMNQAVHRHWMAAHGGAIVSIVADMWNGFPGMAHTGAARAGVVNLTMTLAVEWAQDGVRVNAVAPGFVLSSGLANYPAYVQEMAAEVMSKNPSARLATEAEVSAAVTFLLSPAAAYVTGHTLRVDGGSSLVKAPLFPLSDAPKLPVYNGFHRASDIPERFKP
jgi:citronellol/citronellal dehydrogenase